MKRLPPLALVLSLLAGCAGSDDPDAGSATPPPATAPVPAPSGQSTPPTTAEPRSTATSSPPAQVPATSPVPPTRGEPNPPGPPSRGGQGESPPTAAAGTWTAGVVGVERPAVGVAVLDAVRTARHEGFDRVVFELSSAVPGYHLEYVDRPVRSCGSGEPVPLPGDGWLEVRLEPAAAHTEAGSPTVGREVAVDLANVERLVLTCDFEAIVTWVLAVGSPNEFRVSELTGPPRLVVDVRH
jgi:hypothetical protein